MSNQSSIELLSNSFHYNFPPFFTLQPNVETRRAQLKAWRLLVLEYCQINKKYVFEMKSTPNEPLFRNNSINRQLSNDSIKAIFDDLHQNGSIEWFDKKQDKCYVYWKRPEEWAQLIYKWALDKALINSVCTLYEITSSDDTIGYDFHGLNQNILLKALQSLENEGKAAIINFDGNSGVKFL